MTDKMVTGMPWPTPPGPPAVYCDVCGRCFPRWVAELTQVTGPSSASGELLICKECAGQ